MKIIKFKILVLLIASIAFSFSSCKKSDDSNPSNPTNGKSTAVFNPNVTYGTMTDQDGNVYKTITFGSKKSTNGTQTWMAENLKTTKYRNGEAIPKIIEFDIWKNLSTGAFCNVQNTENTDTIQTFGRLYNWNAVTDARNIAPLGWHVPTQDELLTLINNCGGGKYGGAKLKEKGTTHWHATNADANNASGFTALPSGYRYIDGFGGYPGNFAYFGTYGRYWSSTPYTIEPNAYYLDLCYADATVGVNNANKACGLAVRLIKD